MEGRLLRLPRVKSMEGSKNLPCNRDWAVIKHCPLELGVTEFALRKDFRQTNLVRRARQKQELKYYENRFYRHRVA